MVLNGRRSCEAQKMEPQREYCQGPGRMDGKGPPSGGPEFILSGPSSSWFNLVQLHTEPTLADRDRFGPDLYSIPAQVS